MGMQTTQKSDNPVDESLITRSRLSIGIQTSNLRFD